MEKINLKKEAGNILFGTIQCVCSNLILIYLIKKQFQIFVQVKEETEKILSFVVKKRKVQVRLQK